MMLRSNGSRNNKLNDVFQTNGATRNVSPDDSLRSEGGNRSNGHCGGTARQRSRSNHRAPRSGKGEDTERGKLSMSSPSLLVQPLQPFASTASTNRFERCLFLLLGFLGTQFLVNTMQLHTSFEGSSFRLVVHQGLCDRGNSALREGRSENDDLILHRQGKESEDWEAKFERHIKEEIQNALQERKDRDIKAAAMPGVAGIRGILRANRTVRYKNALQNWVNRHWDPGRGIGRRRGRVGSFPIKTGLPIFVPSLPKSGTTSIWQYFNCGGHSASHQWYRYNATYSEQLGRCIKRNIQEDKPPFQACGPYNVFTDTGYALYNSDPKLYHEIGDCYYPSVQALQSIYDYYPNATIVNVVRNTTEWYNSMTNWGNGTLLARWRICPIPDFPTLNSDGNDIMQFYEWHTNNLRHFAHAHPSLHYVEIQLEALDAGHVLEQEIGIPSTCWGKCSPTSKFCEQVGAVS